MMRSLLFVPGDSLRKFEKARACPADALILDLEDSVAGVAKDAARGIVVQMLAGRNDRQSLFVRVNGFDTGLAAPDLAAVMAARPDGIVLPKCEGPDDVRRLSHMLDALEAANGTASGTTGIIGIATETAASLFTLGTYGGCSPRLAGIMWGAEDLAAALGATTNRDDQGLLEQFRHARFLCLAGAKAAGIMPIDTVATNIDDLDALAAEAQAARRDGFVAKAVIHPKHVAVVNAAFSPTAQEIAEARAVVAAFAAAGDAGVIRQNGQMLDKPHLLAARRILQAAD